MYFLIVLPDFFRSCSTSGNGGPHNLLKTSGPLKGAIRVSVFWPENHFVSLSARRNLASFHTWASNQDRFRIININLCVVYCVSKASDWELLSLSCDNIWSKATFLKFFQSLLSTKLNAWFISRPLNSFCWFKTLITVFRLTATRVVCWKGKGTKKKRLFLNWC